MSNVKKVISDNKNKEKPVVKLIISGKYLTVNNRQKKSDKSVYFSLLYLIISKIPRQYLFCLFCFFLSDHRTHLRSPNLISGKPVGASTFPVFI